MKIKKIMVKNFRCFEDISTQINDFNVVIGKNASGKSNFINIFKFINDILMFGIDDAIAIQGGINYLCNAKIGRTQNIELGFSIQMDSEEKDRYIINRFDNEYNIKMNSYDVEISIRPNKRGNGYKIVKDYLRLNYTLQELKNKEMLHRRLIKPEDYEDIKEFYQEWVRKDEHSNVIEQLSEEIPEQVEKNITISNDRLMYRLKKDSNETQLLINILPYMRFYRPRWNENLITVYDFDSKSLKNSAVINEKKSLEEDGANISNIIQKILKNPQEKKKLLLLLKEVLPFITEIGVESNFDKSLYFKVSENNYKMELPSYLLSDGTVNIIAIIIALYFQKNNNTIIIEEPEKNMHPKLAQQIVRMMKDNSDKKQLLITTHSTHLLSAIQLEDVIYIYRNKQGFSDVIKPKNNKKVEKFIENEVEIGDLFYDSMFSDEEV